MEKNKKIRLRKCFVSVAIVMEMLFIGISTPMAMEPKDGKKDVKIQLRKDAGEVNKNDQGETEYIVYQKKDKTAMQKFKCKRQKDNKNVEKFGKSILRCLALRPRNYAKWKKIRMSSLRRITCWKVANQTRHGRTG